MLSIAVCDDEPHFQKRIKELISAYLDNLEVVEKYDGQYVIDYDDKELFSPVFFAKARLTSLFLLFPKRPDFFQFCYGN